MDETPTPPRWWDFIGYRREYVSDRTWFGLALIAGGLGSVGEVSGWWKVVNVGGALVGGGLIGSGLRSRLRRSSTTKR